MIRSIVMFITVAALSSPVLAHKVNVFAYVEGGQLYIEGYFNDGKKARNSTVNIVDGDGNVLLSDVTDDEGQLIFQLPQQPAQLRVVLNAGMGHQAEYVVSAEDMGGAAVSAGSPQPTMEQTTAPSSAAPAVDQAQLEAIVERAVGDAIKPLVRELAAAREQASLSDIIGGIGLIIGALGGFAFFKARQGTSASSGDQGR